MPFNRRLKPPKPLRPARLPLSLITVSIPEEYVNRSGTRRRRGKDHLNPPAKCRADSRDAIPLMRPPATYPNTNSAGGVEVEGDLNFEGIDVPLAGLYLSLRNTINVKMPIRLPLWQCPGYEVKINRQYDDSITIDSGGGDDVLDISIRQSPSVSISLTKGEGFDADTGELTETGQNLVKGLINAGLSELGGSGGTSSDTRLKAVISGGAGDDEITITLINSTDITTTQDETPNTAPTGVEFDLDLSATDLTVNGGAGTDTITVNGGMELGLTTVILNPILQAMLDYTPVAADALNIPGTEIKINGGAGDDLINVHTTASFSSFRGVDVTVDGGAAYDRTNLTGKLQDYEDNNNNISGDADRVEMSTLAEINILNDLAAISRLKACFPSI